MWPSVNSHVIKLRPSGLPSIGLEVVVLELMADARGCGVGAVL